MSRKLSTGRHKAVSFGGDLQMMSWVALSRHYWATSLSFYSKKCRQWAKINFPPVVPSSNKYNSLKQLQCCTERKKMFLSSKLLKEIFHLTPLKFFHKKITHRLFAIHFMQKKESTYKSYVPETFNKFSNFRKKNFLNFHTNKFSSSFFIFYVKILTICFSFNLESCEEEKKLLHKNYWFSLTFSFLWMYMVNFNNSKNFFCT